MFALVSKVLGRNRRSRLSPARRPARTRLSCEALEDRQLLSVAAEFPVNTRALGNQHHSANAMAANGRSVVVWADQASTTNNDIRAQVYDSAGNRVGGEILVAGSSKNEYDPQVAMDAAGNFVVVWTLDYSSSDQDIEAARFAANGSRLGSLSVANTSSWDEAEPSVARGTDGSFVVSYTLTGAGVSGDVWVHRYWANGGLAGAFAVANSGNAEYSSHVAMTPGGRFAVAYQKEYGGSDADIRLARYNALGVPLGDLAMDVSSRRDTHPAVSVDIYFNAVVAYQVQAPYSNMDIHARRVSDNGTVGPELRIATAGEWEIQPSVALDPTYGKFVVAYWGYLANTTVSVCYVREVTASDSVGPAMFLGSDLFNPAVSIGGDHYYLVTYTKTSVLLPGQEIYGRRGYQGAAIDVYRPLPFLRQASMVAVGAAGAHDLGPATTGTSRRSLDEVFAGTAVQEMFRQHEPAFALDDGFHG